MNHKYIITDKRKKGFVFTHTYTKFKEVRQFCEHNVRQYNNQLSMAETVSAIEDESGLTFSIMPGSVSNAVIQNN